VVRAAKLSPLAGRIVGPGALAPWLAVAVAASGCDPDRPDIDPFPIAIDTSAGPVVIGASLGGGDPSPVVLDTLSPQTAWVTAGASPGRRHAHLTLWNAPGAGEAPVPRARFWGVTVFEVDPCAGQTPCLLGAGETNASFEGIIGSDVLSGLAVTLEIAAGELRFHPDIPLSDVAHGRMCKAVFRQPFAGGGTLLIGGAEESFEGRRAVLSACIDFDEAASSSQRGADALLLLSTGLGPTLLGESTYARYRARSGAPPASELPMATMHLPAGPVNARVGEISSLALAGADSSERGACEELHLHRAMRLDACRRGEMEVCPCPGGAMTCRADAVVDLGGPLQVAIIPDDDPLLQALRSELRPGFADIGGILGASALFGHRVELDYPNNRILFSCVGPDCATYPAIRSDETMPEIAHCF
jgi:hypothetical protein